MFEKLTAYLDGLQKDFGIPATDIVIYRDGEAVYRHMTGFSDAAGTKPTSEQDTYWLYSASKVITCAAAMQLVEQGKLDLEAPVGNYLPAWKLLTVKSESDPVPAKNALLVKHLFSMCGGLNYDLNAPSLQRIATASNGKATTRQVIDALAAEPLDFEPGTHWQYSLCHDVIGALIEAVSGETFGAYLQEHIFTPLHMVDTTFHPTSAQLARMAEQYRYHDDTRTSTVCGKQNTFFITSVYESGGATLCSTVNDYGLFVSAMARGGISAEGVRILRSETVERMHQNALSGDTKTDFDKLNRVGYSYALGVRVLVEKEQSKAGSPLGEFGWDGAAGAYAMIDTTNRIGVFYAQHVLSCTPAYYVIHPHIRDLIYEELGL